MDRGMRILYVQPGPGIGGSKISLYHILQCAPAGQVSHVALTLPPDPGYERGLSSFVEKFHYLELPAWNKYRRKSLLEKIKAPVSHFRILISLLPAVSRLTRIIKDEQIDLVHTNNSICAAGAFAAYLAGVPHLWHVREPIGTAGEYPLIVGDWLSGFLFRVLSRAIVCNSLYTANFFCQRDIQVRVIRNGLDIPLFQVAEAEERGCQLRRKLIGEPDSLVVAMIGNLTTRWKEHRFFLELAAKIRLLFPKCYFVIFGGSSNLDLTPYTQELRQTSERLNIQDLLVWADFIEDIPAMMHSMDILVHPPSKEGSGRVVMEALAAGRAVVGVKSGGVQELIQDGITGFLVPPSDIQTMTDKVRFLLENPRERISMGLRASEYARQNFSNQAMMRSVLAIYQELI